VGTGAWLADCAAGAASVSASAAAGALARSVRVGRRVAAPLAGVAGPAQLLLDPLAQRGRAVRAARAARLDALSRLLVPRAVDLVLDRIDLTALVLERVDLSRLLAAAPVQEVVDRVDVDDVAARLDLAAVLDRLDLTALVLERVDLSRLLAAAPVAEVVERVDVDAVAARGDVDAVAARLDVEAFLDRLDLAGIAREVVEEIDLPEIIRESTGAMASETVRSVRMQGIGADERVSAVVDRLLARRGRRRGEVPAVAGAAEIPQQREVAPEPVDQPAAPAPPDRR
jgi:hypothetical protein